MFSTGTDTLYGWTPTSTGAYAGTCMFLIILAAISRFLIALRSILEKRQSDVQLSRRQEPVSSSPQSSSVLLKDNGIEEEIVVVRHNSRDVRHWRATVDGPSAAVSAILAGVLYFL